MTPHLRGRRAAAARWRKRWSLGLAVLALAAPVLAQKTDVVVMRNGDRNTGEFRSYDEGNVTLKTDDQGDLKIKWNKIVSITSDKTFEVELTDGTRVWGKLEPSDPPGKLVVVSEGFRTALGFLDIIRIAPLYQSVWTALNGSADLGFTYTEANHFVQFNFNGEATYRHKDFQVATQLSVFLSNQEGATSSQRASWNIEYQHFLQNRWFAGVLTRFDHNKELGLDLRALAGIGLGRHVVQRNQSSLDLFLGISASRETPYEGESRTNSEAIVSGEYSQFMYDFPKLRLGVTVTVYPSLSDGGRVRLQADAFLRRDIITDFYVSISIFDSFDNRPPTPGAAKNDWGPVISAGYKF